MHNLNRNIDNRCFFWVFLQVFDGLEGVENYLKIFNSEGLHLPILTMNCEELQEAIKGCTATTLQKGQTLVNKADSHRYSFHFYMSAAFLRIYLLLYNLTS